MMEAKDAQVTSPQPKQCKCGTTRDNPMAAAEREYTFLGTLYLLWGGTAIPREVKFRCVRCGEVFDRTDHPAVLRKYVV